MASYLYPVATVTPENAYPQAVIGQYMKAQANGERKLERLIERVYRHSGIETRHSVLGDLQGLEQEGFFFGRGGALSSPSTGARNERYRAEAGRLFVCAARRALANCPWLEPRDITHVVTVSCTGFFAPGPDYLIVREMGLSPATRRYHLGFMGCYAAFPALELAQSLCEAEPTANVLVVCLELCTLHLQPQQDIDSILAASLFDDGGAATVVSSRVPQGEAALELGTLHTALTPEGEADMAWTIGDTGFEMVLSSYVPEVLGANVGSLVTPLLEAEGTSAQGIPHWAVHPGGRAILDRVACSLGLGEEQLAASRRILADYGNMSSATVLFVLERVQREAQPGEAVFSLAFGPGLTVASGFFTRA